MSDTPSPGRRLFNELRRRRLFRTAALYIVGTWLVLQVADVVFPAMDIPERAIRYLLLAAVLGFPAALVFGWFFDVGVHGISRTSPAGAGELAATQSLRRSDYLILTALAGVAAFILYNAVGNVIETPRVVRDTRTDSFPIVAVLPFTFASVGGDGEFFATGVHDDLLTQLALLQSIRVISKTSVLEYKDTKKNVRVIGAELGADAILKGRVQSAGDRIRINAQLIDAKTDEYLWAKTYDRELTAANIFDVQTEISRAITSAMNATLTEQENLQLAIVPTENMAAYRAYHRAMQILDAQGSFLKDDLRLALEEAVTLDPNFTRAWAELAGHLAFQNFLGTYRPEFLGRPEEILEKIRQVAPGSADHLMAQAYYAYYTLKDYELAHRFVSEAHAMRPSDTRLLMLKTWIERRQGDYDSRIETIRQARTLDPRDPTWTDMLVMNLYLTHRYDEVRYELENAGTESYDRNVLLRFLQLREHRDIARWAADIERLQELYEEDADPVLLWDAYIANRDYAAAETLLDSLPEEYLDSPEVGNPHLSERNSGEIITYWFTGKKELLEKSVLRGRAHLDKSRSADGSFEHKDLVGDEALFYAVEGDTEKAELIMRRGLRATEVDRAFVTGAMRYACQTFGIANATEAAVECIRRALVEPSDVAPFLEPYLPYYDSMRDEPEFIELLADIDRAAT